MGNLEYLRRLKGMSQQELAAALGCHPSVLSKLERGWQVKVSDQTTARLVSFFGCEWSLEKLLSQHQTQIKPDPTSQDAE
jgi:transcriptional regulator with XRE-family HTH domain